MESAEGFIDLVLSAGYDDFENGQKPEEAIALVKSRDKAILEKCFERVEKELWSWEKYDEQIKAMTKEEVSIWILERIKTAIMNYGEGNEV